jgi:hypothetical protein
MRIKFFLILLLTGTIAVCQQKATVVVKGEDKLEKLLPQEMMFAFKEFSVAKIYLKDGNVNSTKININLYTNDILFWNSKSQVMVLSNPMDIQKIMVGDALWLPVGGTFGEVIYTTKSFSLLRIKETSTTELRKESGFGTTSPTSSVRSVTSVNTQAKSVDILPVGEYDFETKTTYYLSADSKNTQADARGFKKVFSAYKKDIDTYLKANKINFKEKKDIITLLDFCAGLGK